MTRFALAMLLVLGTVMAVAPVACVDIAIKTGILVKKEPPK